MDKQKKYIECEKDKYIRLSQALEVLDSCSCWWAHERMECIPAADVRPVVRGHFGKHTSPFTAPCSECGTSMNMHWNFCPNCGADMRGN